MSIQQRKDGRYLVWVQLLWQSEKRSEIVEDEEEYYSQHDPARQFREMELKSLATKELVNEEEMEDGDFSDEESEGSADSVRDDEDEENSVTTVTDSTAKLPQDSSRRVPLKPRHKRLYEAMLADDYAMAILHLSATDYLDDTVTPLQMREERSAPWTSQAHTSLLQSPRRQWHDRRSENDECIFHNIIEGHPVHIAVFVDDFKITCKKVKFHAQVIMNLSICTSEVFVFHLELGFDGLYDRVILKSSTKTVWIG
jgi:hypothetical protein